MPTSEVALFGPAMVLAVDSHRSCLPQPFHGARLATGRHIFFSLTAPSCKNSKKMRLMTGGGCASSMASSAREGGEERLPTSEVALFGPAMVLAVDSHRSCLPQPFHGARLATGRHIFLLTTPRPCSLLFNCYC